MNLIRWKLLLSELICISMVQACAAQPDTLPVGETEPVESSTAQTGVIEPSGSATAETGVVYPEKAGKPQKIKDALPQAERTQAENDRLAQMQFTVEPRQQIEKYLKSLKLPNDFPILQRAHVFYVDNAALKKAFPDAVFYGLRFAQWPIAIATPAPLGNNNLFYIAKNAKDLVLLTDIDQDSLRKFLIGNMTAHSEGDGKTAAEASLALAQELAQDGMYKFELSEDSVQATKTANALKATGQVNVVPTGGNSGSIVVNLAFGDNGELTDFKQTVKLMAGMRPICQSTKLLDPDPIVRQMAEQDILIMGSSAKEYLDWQRPQVSPELRKAIDRIWVRIKREGR